MVERFRLLGAVAGAAVVVMACGGGSSGGDQGTAGSQLKALDHHVSVNFWHAMHSGVQAPAIKQVADDFNASQKNVTVNLVDQVDYATLNNKTLAALAAGSPPDAAQCYENWADKYNQSRALADLTPYLNAADGISKADQQDFWPIMLQDGKLNGTQFMMPFNKSDIVLYYNVDKLQAAGLSEAPKTWDEVKAVAPKLTKGSTEWALDFSDQLGVENLFASQLYAFGGTVLDKSGKKSAFNQAPGQQVLSMWADLVKAGYAHQVAGSSFPDQTDFQAGRTGLYISTIASYPFVKSGVGSKFKWKTAPVPAGPRGSVTEMFGTNACVFAKAPKDVQQGAFQFIKYFTSHDVTTTWSQKTGYMPVRQSAFKDMQSSFYSQGSNADLAVAPNQLKTAITEPPLAAWNEGANKVLVEIGNALGGKKTAKQALDDAAKQVDDLLVGG